MTRIPLVSVKLPPQVSVPLRGAHGSYVQASPHLSLEYDPALAVVVIAGYGKTFFLHAAGCLLEVDKPKYAHPPKADGNVVQRKVGRPRKHPRSSE